MCGIAGAVSARPVDPRTVERMRDRLEHRGPDHAGLWRSEDGRACLGHRRLSILDLSAAAHQPFTSGDGRFVLAFNGEIYNHERLRRLLEKEGVRFRTRSDTEVLVEAYACWGEGCLESLAGMFAFAIWDRVEQRLFCARDRAGEKPFHYALVGESFVLASELKALLPWPGFRREISYEAVGDFLTFGFVPDPKTIWSGCHKLPPGHRLVVECAGGVPVPGRPEPYWDMEFDPDRSVDDWGPEIRSTLTAAAGDMAVADVPVGTFLSGGVDSSSITAALALGGRPPRAFTIGFEEHGFDERPWARQVAKRYECDHVERTVGHEDVSGLLDRLHWHYDEPFNDFSYLPTFQVCREARRSVTVALSGDGGDEAFGGYRKYRRLARRDAVDPFVPAAVGNGFARAATALLPERSGMRALARDYGGAPERLLTAMLVTGLPGERLRAVARGPLRTALGSHDPEDEAARLIERAPPRDVGLVNSMRYLDLKLTLAGGILVKVDRASMAVSLEVRPVFLHPDLLALAGRIPPERTATAVTAKAALKQAFEPWLPRELLQRPKAGFAMPLGRWLSGELRALALPAGGSDPLDELIDRRFAEELARGHIAGRVDATATLHAFLFLRQWLARWTG